MLYYRLPLEVCRSRRRYAYYIEGESKLQYSFSEKFKLLKPPAITEILKTESGKNVIPFSAGNPAEESFTADFVRRASAQILETRPQEALQYGASEGYEPLRETLRKRAESRLGIDMKNNDVIVVSGAQQGIELSAKVMCNEGDTVVSENPTFLGALNAFRSVGARLHGIPVLPDGADADTLEKALCADNRVKLVYLTPNFQNPTGVTATAERRRELYEIARRHDVLILEDDSYRETRFCGEDVPSIKSIDEDGRVIYCGSFSKVMSAGMRVGFVIAAPELIAKLTVAKQVCDIHTNMLAQMIVDSFINFDNVENHINKVRRLYKKRYELMEECAEKYFPANVKRGKTEGGLFLWCGLPEKSDARAVCALAKEKQISIVPGSALAVNEGNNIPYIRLNYSAPSEEQIESGMQILGGILREYVESL